MQNAFIIAAIVHLFTDMITALLTPANIKIGLYSARATNISPDMQMSNLSECTFNGYTAGGVNPAAFSAPVAFGEGTIGVEVNPPLVFQPTDGLVPQNAKGWFAFNTVLNSLVKVEDFDVPVPMTNAMDRLVLAARFALDPQQTFGKTPVVA